MIFSSRRGDGGRGENSRRWKGWMETSENEVRRTDRTRKMTESQTEWGKRILHTDSYRKPFNGERQKEQHRRSGFPKE